jgi:hypothetical protein
MRPLRSFSLACLPRRLLGTGLALGLASMPGLGAAQHLHPLPVRTAPTVSWRVDEAVVTVAFDAAMLRLLGLRATQVQPTAPNQTHPLSIVDPRAPSFRAAPEGLAVVVDEAVFRGFADGALRLHGGFRLVHATGRLDFAGAVVRAGEEPYALELVAADGTAVLASAQAQVDVDLERGTLRYMNADLRVLPAFAERLGDPRLTGTTVGGFALDAILAIGPAPPRLVVAAASTPPACDDWSGEVDVALTAIDSVGQAGSPADGRVVVVPSVTLKNVGTANVPWYSKFTGPFPPYDNDQHPFLAWQMLRARDGVLAPLGRSEMKHAFRTGNYNCLPGACTHPQILGLGCEDPYNIQSNTTNSALGPRAELTASTGVWHHCGSHFDTDGDCAQDTAHHSSGDYHTHGMKVATADLGDPAARYFVEAFYVIRDDIDIFNTMGFREVTPTLSASPSLWLFPAAGAYTQGPAIDAWAPPATPASDVENRVVATGEGHVQLAARVTELDGDRWRFAYALQNHDFDRRIDSVHVPFDASAGVTAVGFADGDGFAANDWMATADASGITWTAPAGASPAAELDWGTLFAFHFEIDRAAGPALATLGVFEPGSPTELRLRTLVPGAAAPALDFHTVTPCRLLDTRSAAAGNTPVPSGRARVLDVPAVAACGVPPSAAAVAVNVTVTGATAGGHLTVYAADLPAPPATSTLGFGAGITRANSAVVTLSPEGRMKLRPLLAVPGSVHTIVDVVGYFAAAP